MEGKRMTAFNAFCSEKRKGNPGAGFRMTMWAREWHQLSCEAKKYYKEKAQALGKKCAAVNSLWKIKKLINSLEGTSDREALGIQAIGLVILKNGTLDAYGFGGLQNCLKDMALHLKLLGLSTGGDMANIKKSTIDELRKQAQRKMSKIAKEQLGLNQFPYKRVQKGDFILSGIPPSLLPLQPAGKLAIKDLEELLAAHISVSRVPAARQAKGTDLPQAVAVQVTELPQEAVVQVIDMPQEAAVEVCDSPQEAVRNLNLLPPSHNSLPKRVPTSKAENTAKKPRKEWDEEALKAVEELLHGPPVGLHQLEELKGQIPALTKFSAMQIYVKLYSRKQ
ncbi:uncharacterized protein LOC112561832 isoform X2 [Pomacea canaliculata]|nr:uncharacterized protein LOC112561832 isoform X2 [Pomacea canaliculata]